MMLQIGNDRHPPLPREGCSFFSPYIIPAGSASTPTRTALLFPDGEFR